MFAAGNYSMSFRAATPAERLNGLHGSPNNGSTRFCGRRSTYRRHTGPSMTRSCQVADPFHVIRLANSALDDVRRRVQNETLGHRGRRDDPLHRVSIGFERFIVNSTTWRDRGLVRALADQSGSSSVVWSIDVKRNRLGREQVLINDGSGEISLGPEEWPQELERRGADELLRSSIDRDGAMSGHDADLVRRVSQAVDVPVIAVGGVSSVDDMRHVVREGRAAAAAAGQCSSLKPNRVPFRSPIPKRPSAAKSRAFEGGQWIQGSRS